MSVSIFYTSHLTRVETGARAAGGAAAPAQFRRQRPTYCQSKPHLAFCYRILYSVSLKLT